MIFQSSNRRWSWQQQQSLILVAVASRSRSWRGHRRGMHCVPRLKSYTDYSRTWRNKSRGFGRSRLRGALDGAKDGALIAWCVWTGWVCGKTNSSASNRGGRRYRGPGNAVGARSSEPGHSKSLTTQYGLSSTRSVQQRTRWQCLPIKLFSNTLKNAKRMLRRLQSGSCFRNATYNVGYFRYIFDDADLRRKQDWEVHGHPGIRVGQVKAPSGVKPKIIVYNPNE